jgi:hypothetical protein
LSDTASVLSQNLIRHLPIAAHKAGNSTGSTQGNIGLAWHVPSEDNLHQCRMAGCCGHALLTTYPQEDK